MTNFDIENTLSQLAQETLNEIPEDISEREDIRYILRKALNAQNLGEHARDIEDVFQFDIPKDKEFKRGFPGIVLTSIVGRLVEPSYNPSNAFYDIHPRALFERRIAPALRNRYQAPMGKSDPLNVAKNTNIIDANWARGKRPEYAAKAAVNLISWVCDAEDTSLMNLLRSFILVYMGLAKLYNPVYTLPTSDNQLQDVFEMLCTFINQAPAGGATAQAVVGAALAAQHQCFGVSNALSGVGESINATNTTANKPGDFAEQLGKQLHIYEVTVKPIDEQRILESAEAVKKFLANSEEEFDNLEVTFLFDPKTNGDFQLETETGITYNMCDLWSWLFNLLERLGPKGRTLTLEGVTEYVQENSTQLYVKQVWQQLIE